MEEGEGEAIAVIGPERRRLPASGGLVEYVVLRLPDTEQYPSGWKYRLYLGDADGNTVVRYDNRHEATDGHERHTGPNDEPKIIDFPGMEELFRKFQREVETYERKHE